MKNSTIEWTDHTINFWWGCTKVSPACTHCYAESLAKVFGKPLFGAVPEWGSGKPRQERLKAARKEAFALNKRAEKEQNKWESETKELLSRGSFHPNPRPQRPRVFVNSMSDWLDAEVPIEWLADLLETLYLCSNLDFQLLTKRPENWDSRLSKVLSHLADSGLYNTEQHGWISEWRHDVKTPPNLWIGTTVENQEWADKRMPHLLRIPAAVRFLSCEPLLGELDLSRMEYFTAKLGKYPFNLPPEHRSSVLVGIDWVITGGESGGHARPSHPNWFRSLRDQCAASEIPFFFKQWGEWISVDNAKDCPSGRLDKKYKGHKFPDGTLALRIGTSHTGHLLDGIAHQAFPALAAPPPPSKDATECCPRCSSTNLLTRPGHWWQCHDCQAYEFGAPTNPRP